MQIIDMKEMATYITKQLKKQGIVATEDYILKVLMLEEDFLRLKGVIQD